MKIQCGSLFREQFVSFSNSNSNSNSPKIISFVNPFSYYQLKDNEIYQQIDMLFSDGALLCFLHGLFYNKIERASFDFSSVANFVFEESINTKARVAVIGATSFENDKAISILKNKYPLMNIVYSRDGYIEDRSESLNRVELFRPDLIILGMGTPYQEDFAIYLKNNLEFNCLILTCGGFLSQTSIRDDYYLPIVKKLGLRWLQRAIMHKHVRKRLFNEYPKFVFRYIREGLFS